MQDLVKNSTLTPQKSVSSIFFLYCCTRRLTLPMERDVSILDFLFTVHCGYIEFAIFTKYYKPIDVVEHGEYMQ